MPREAQNGARGGHVGQNCKMKSSRPKKIEGAELTHFFFGFSDPKLGVENRIFCSCFHFQVDENKLNYFGASWARFWMVFGCQHGPKRELKIRSRKT